MTNQKLKLNTVSTIMACACLSTSICFTGGCRKEEPPPPPPPVQTGPREPETPRWQEIAAIVPLADNIEVENALFENTTKSQMEACFKFINAFATGDSDTLKPMFDSVSKQVLDELLTTGEWTEQTSSIRELVLLGCFKVDTKSFIFSFDLSFHGGKTITLNWKANQRGDMFIFTPNPIIPTPKSVSDMANSADTDTSTTSNNEDSGSRGKDRQPSNPTDPRKRIPKQNPGTNPGGPG